MNMGEKKVLWIKAGRARMRAFREPAGLRETV
jgi:hypothetical protein